MNPLVEAILTAWGDEVGMALPRHKLTQLAAMAARVSVEQCAAVAHQRAELWRWVWGGQMASPYSDLTVEGECEVIRDTIRALAPPDW